MRYTCPVWGKQCKCLQIFFLNIGECAYLNNVDYTIIIETLTIQGTKWIYVSDKYKWFEVKYLNKIA